MELKFCIFDTVVIKLTTKGVNRIRFYMMDTLIKNIKRNENCLLDWENNKTAEEFEMLKNDEHSCVHELIKDLIIYKDRLDKFYTYDESETRLKDGSFLKLNFNTLMKCFYEYEDGFRDCFYDESIIVISDNYSYKNVVDISNLF